MKKYVILTTLVVLVALGFWGLRSQPSPSQGNARGNGHNVAAASQTTAPSHSAAPTAVSTAASATAPATQISGPVAASDSRQFHLKVNPYAGGLKVPGKSKREWDVNFLKEHEDAAAGQPIHFELTQGELASGVIKIVQRDDQGVKYLSGKLSEPESGKFFFLRPPAGGKAGKAVGVVEFPASQTAYRIEPTGPDGAPELWQRRLDEVLCLNMAPPKAAAASTNVVEEAPPLRPDAEPDYVPTYNTNTYSTPIISLQSNPGSSAVLLLDFFGGYTPTWGGVEYAAPTNISNASIKDLWKRVAEDYMPFNINVTTDRKVYEAAPAASRQRCCFTTTPITAAGVAYEGSWNWGNDTPCWSVYTSGKAGAEVGAHEPGHTLGLSHDGQDIPDGSGGTTHNEYYAGQGSGVTGWAPIMGAGYYQPVTTFSKGEYQYANNHEDQLNIITTVNNNVTYRADDTGDTLATARYLEIYSNYTASAEGLIERTDDTDAFRFSTTGGSISLTANPVGDWANLAISATLANQFDVVIASNNPPSSLSASISTYLSAGTYTFRVTGAGRKDPLTDGFSDYDSMGYYSVTGSVAGAVLPNRFSVAENTPNGTIVGTIGANNPNGNPLVYAITSGNTSNAFRVYNNGVLVVGNSSVLNYEALAMNTQFPVQFELFVNITNTVNSSLTELNRRVVVQVLDVNEPPVVSGATEYVLAGTPAGTPVGAVEATDPDFYTVLNYSITGGNGAGLFTIGASDGILRLAATPSSAQVGIYNLTVRAADTSATPNSASANILVNVGLKTTSLTPGNIAWAVYDGIGGSTVGDLTGNANFPSNPTFVKLLPQMDSDHDRADGYGSVMHGYVIPPITGDYTFFLASDDNGSLLLSPDTNAAHAAQIASVVGGGGVTWTDPNQWTKFASQRSPVEHLVAGQAYYIEARQKENGGGDFLQVAWTGPATGGRTNIIPGRFLAPASINYQPQVSGFSANVRRDSIQGNRVGQLEITDPNEDQTTTCSIVSGNNLGIFAVDNSGWVSVANPALLGVTATSNFSLVIRATDNGTPSLSATGTVTLTVVPAGTLPSDWRREIFSNISGGNLADLTNNAAYPGRPDSLEVMTDFDSKRDIANSYGSRARAVLVPPATGQYRFWLSADNGAVLNLSMSPNPAGISTIASVPDAQWSDSDQWTKFASQTSGFITLNAGQKYYLEVIQKEDNGGDFLQVAWSGPGLPAGTNIIASNYLQPVDINLPPTLANASAYMPQSIGNGDLVTTLAAKDSPLDTLTYQIVSGNTSSTFAIQPDSGRITVANNAGIASGTLTDFTLTVKVQDSGYGGLYPLHSTTATVNIKVMPDGMAVPGMVHRYSFTADASDSLGSANGTPNGGIIFSGGRAYFNGTSGYVSLPGGMLSSYPNASFEFWATIQNNGNWPELFSFGQQGGSGTGYLAFIPRSAYNDYRLSYNPGSEYVITGPAGKTLDNNMPVYVACVYDQSHNLMNLYTNGVLAVSGVPPTALNLDNVRTNFSYLGKSLFSDPYLKGTMDEFRIWNTALTPEQVALDYLTGPNQASSAAAPVALRLTAASTFLNSGNMRQVEVYADFDQVSNVLVTPYVTHWSSSQSSIVQVDTNGLAQAIYPGNAIISAAYGGLTASLNLAVNLTAPVIVGQPLSQTRTVGETAIFNVSASGGSLSYQWCKNGGNIVGATNETLVLSNVSFVDDADYRVVVSNAIGHAVSDVAQLAIASPALLHRWSFNSNNGIDSVGGANAVLQGSASYSGGKLLVPGGSARANCARVDLAATLASHPSLTVETWFTMSSLQNWSKVWMFGNANGGNEIGLSYMGFTPRAGADGNVPSMSINTTAGTEFNTRGGANPALMNAGTEYHVVAVYDAGANQMRLYINGVLADAGSMGGGNITQLSANEAYFGASVNYGDANLNGVINEIRIWNAPLTVAEIATNDAAGPNSLVSYQPPVTLNMAAPAGALTLTWSYGVLEEAADLSGPWTTVPGASSPFTPPTDAPKMFYRVRAN